MITERLHAVGEWSLELDQAIPPSLLKLFTLDPSDPRTVGAATLVVTAAWVDPASIDIGGGVDTFHPLMDVAVYCGIVTGRSPDGLGLSGHGLAWHLGTPDGTGELFVGNAMTSSSEQNARIFVEDSDDWLEYLVNGGAMTAGDGSGAGITLRGTRLWNATHHGTPVADIPYYPSAAGPLTRGEMLTRICTYTGQQWYVSPRAYVHMGTQAAMFPGGPRCVVAPDLDADPAWMTILTPDIGWDQDMAGWANKWVSFNQGKNDTYPQDTIYAYPNNTYPIDEFYRGLDGEAIHIVERDDAGTEENILSWAERIIAAQDQRQRLRRQITVAGTADAHAYRLIVGEPLFVENPSEGLLDTDVEVWVGGRAHHPTVVDLHSVRWGIPKGAGVYLLLHDGDADAFVTYDLSRMFVPEDGQDTVLEVGAPRPALTPPQWSRESR